MDSVRLMCLSRLAVAVCMVAFPVAIFGQDGEVEDPFAHAAAARQRYTEGAYAEAARLYARAATLHPHFPAWAYNAAVAHTRHGSDDEAVRWLGRAAALGAWFDAEGAEAFARLHGRADFERVLGRFRENARPIVTSDTAFVLEQRDLMPESIAYDPETGAFYAGSIYRRKIVRRFPDGRVEDFVPEARDGLWGVLGIKLDVPRRELWANACNLGGEMPMAEPDPESVGSAGVFRFDLSSGRLIRKYVSEGDSTSLCFNDQTIASSGEVYVSAGSDGVYRIRPESDRAEPFLRSGQLQVNGLALSVDERSLYLTNGSRGVGVADLVTRDVRVVRLPIDVTLNWIDGLYVYGASLVGVQNGLTPQRVVQAFLSPTGDSVVALRVIDSNHPAFAGPTTGVIVGDSLYYVATTQLGSAFQDDGALRSEGELRVNVILRAPLLKGPAFDSQHSAWSPDGSQLAFDSDRDGDNEIYVMNADGTEPGRLTRSPGRDAHPFWSPDGSKIVFQSPREARESGRVQIWVMGADGSAPRRLTDLDGFAGVPAWSPDGRRIAFQFRPGGFGSGARWEIRVMDVEGQDMVRLTQGGANDQVPNWSPDGSRIAFFSDRDGDNDIYVMGADGSNVMRVTDHPGDDTSPAWSPDGSRISFVSDRGGTRDVYVVEWSPEAGAGAPVRITEGTGARGVPAFDPGDGRLVFHSAMSGRTEIYTVHVDGSDLRRLTYGSEGRD